MQQSGRKKKERYISYNSQVIQQSDVACTMCFCISPTIFSRKWYFLHDVLKETIMNGSKDEKNYITYSLKCILFSWVKKTFAFLFSFRMKWRHRERIALRKKSKMCRLSQVLLHFVFVILVYNYILSLLRIFSLWNCVCNGNVFCCFDFPADFFLTHGQVLLKMAVFWMTEFILGVNYNFTKELRKNVVKEEVTILLLFVCLFFSIITVVFNIIK